MIMVVMGIKGMDGVSTNHSCEWNGIHTHTHTSGGDVKPTVVMKNVTYTHMQFPEVKTFML